MSANLTVEDIEWYSLTSGKASVKESTNFEEAEYFFEGLEYDSGYGLQELDGVIVIKDGTWFQRGEYDGSEWWEYMVTPTRTTYVR
jgi:hypothetical protein